MKKTVFIIFALLVSNLSFSRSDDWMAFPPELMQPGAYYSPSSVVQHPENPRWHIVSILGNMEDGAQGYGALAAKSALSQLIIDCANMQVADFGPTVYYEDTFARGQVLYTHNDEDGNRRFSAVDATKPQELAFFQTLCSIAPHMRKPAYGRWVPMPQDSLSSGITTFYEWKSIAPVEGSEGIYSVRIAASYGNDGIFSEEDSAFIRSAITSSLIDCNSRKVHMSGATDFYEGLFGQGRLIRSKEDTAEPTRWYPVDRTIAPLYDRICSR